jgi:glycosyltransferase involved in cell wall biosynthesis
MVEEDSRTGALIPSNPKIRESRLTVEKKCAESAAALIFCTDAAKDICLERYSFLSSSSCHVISNGFEEHSFQSAERLIKNATESRPGEIRIVHSGAVYPTPDRDPRALFDSLSQLYRRGFFAKRRVKFIFRATGHDDYMRDLVARRGIESLVSLKPALPYIEALAEVLSAHGLLLLQGYTSNPAIPAKLYEYIRSGKPILALIDRDGCTYKLMESLGAYQTASIEDSEEIQRRIQAFVGEIELSQAPAVPDAVIKSFSREHLAGVAASLFEDVVKAHVT